MSDNSRWNLVLIPAVITLAVTLLRLYGELQGWPESMFGTAAGGGMAIVGIAWLVPIFGAYFGWKLTQSGEGPPSLAKAGLMVLAGIAVVMAGFILGSFLNPVAMLVVGGAGSLLGIAVVRLGWQDLVNTLILYGVLARVPVIVIMLLAFQGEWGTHYDAVGPFPLTGLWEKFFFLGVLPQLTFWIFYTAAFGTLFGVVAAAVAASRRTASA